METTYDVYTITAETNTSCSHSKYIFLKNTCWMDKVTLGHY